MFPASPPPVALTAVVEPWVPNLLDSAGYEVLFATSGLAARDIAARITPDIIIVGAILEDMSGTEACRLLRADPQIPRHLPILIALESPATSEMRVAAIRVGAWDFISRTSSPENTLLKLASYVEARHTLADAIDDGFLDPASGFCTRPGLARRAREMSSLATRVHTAFSCVVIEISDRVAVPDLGSVVARAARLSDVVGDLGPRRMGILAPGTDGEGAVRLAARVGYSLERVLASRGEQVLRGTSPLLEAGYDFVPNAAFEPVDPYEILRRASVAVHTGRPELALPWVRRFSGTPPRATELADTAVPTPVSDPARGGK